jgi:RNA polymerase sigma factor (sigma-70 family)
MTSAEREAAYITYVANKLPWLRRVAFLLCRDWHRADDLVQITVTKLYANWGRVDRLENLDGYARKVLVNSYLAEQRSPWWKRVAPHGAAFETAASETAAAADGGPGVAGRSDLESLLDLRAALRTLAPRQRATLVLRYYDQLSVEETAHAMGCSTGNVKSQTARALATLRRTLEPDAEQDAQSGPPAAGSSPAREQNPDSDPGGEEPQGPLVTLIESVNTESALPGGGRL